MSELREVQERVRQLAGERNAVLLVHYYQTADIQEVADHLGDSLELAIQASRTDADVIVFAGVDFMAETAKLVNPGKTVLHPNVSSRCPMAAMVDPTSLRRVKELHPDVPVVAYVNTSAAVKAESDICCTSANAVTVVEGLGADRVIFVPDTNLALHVARHLPEVDVIPWPGHCHVHQGIKVEDVLELQETHPDAETLIHPEAPPMVLLLADVVGSTRGISQRVAESPAREFIIGTEEGLTHHLRELRPDAEFHVVPPGLCPNMKRITLNNIVDSLERLETRIELEADLVERARAPVDRMLDIGRTSR
jgi:quinolinate synthase